MRESDTLSKEEWAEVEKCLLRKTQDGPGDGPAPPSDLEEDDK